MLVNSLYHVLCLSFRKCIHCMRDYDPCLVALFSEGHFCSKMWRKWNACQTAAGYLVSFFHIRISVVNSVLNLKLALLRLKNIESENDTFFIEESPNSKKLAYLIANVFILLLGFQSASWEKFYDKNHLREKTAKHCHLSNVLEYVWNMFLH